MNKSSFTKLTPKQRVEYVNQLLLKEETGELTLAAEHLGFKSSTFGKLMREGDYFYLKAENRYYKFLRDENMIHQEQTNMVDEIAFIKEHFSTIEKLVSGHFNEEQKPEFRLDRRVIRPKGNMVAKNIRLPEEIYEEFLLVCNDVLPYLRLQDIISQLLVQFIDSQSNQAS